MVTVTNDPEHRRRLDALYKTAVSTLHFLLCSASVQTPQLFRRLRWILEGNEETGRYFDPPRTRPELA